MMRVRSRTSRTPGTASAIAIELRRPSSENASAETVRSRPAASTRVLSRMVSRSERAVRPARSVSKGTVLNHAASTPKDRQRHQPRPPFSNHSQQCAHKDVPTTRAPQNKPLGGCQIANERLPERSGFSAIANRFFNAFWHLGQAQQPAPSCSAFWPGDHEPATQQHLPRRARGTLFQRRPPPAATLVRRRRHHLHAAPRPAGAPRPRSSRTATWKSRPISCARR